MGIEMSPRHLGGGSLVSRAMARDTTKYGKYYWCVGLKDEDMTEILLMADSAEVTEGGALQMWGKAQEGQPALQNLILAPGEWSFCYAASVLDGHAVAIDHWPGQIAE